jgi:hypothetical protein
MHLWNTRGVAPSDKRRIGPPYGVAGVWKVLSHYKWTVLFEFTRALPDSPIRFILIYLFCFRTRPSGVPTQSQGGES